MLFARGNPDKATRQAKLHVRMTTSSTLSLNDPNAALEVNVSVRIVDSANPGVPITTLIHRTVFEVFEKGEGGVDMFARGAFGCIRGVDSENNLTERRISLGLFCVRETMRSDALDLRERGYEFLTIPGDGSPVTVTHRLDWNRIFKHEKKLSREDLKPGEKFRVGFNRKYVGTSWWCFGDLEGDLKDRRFHAWCEDDFSDGRPDDDFLREGNWVLCKDPFFLKWVCSAERDDVTFEVVE
ncbi:hypothetical protein DL768_008618 [Monosporascus sp. mg162]|nr:hypothetical protein DL768_008618 [Monosporascus sp. mg162]